MHAICLHNMKYYRQLNCGNKLSNYFNGAFLNFQGSWYQFQLKLVDTKIIAFLSHYFLFLFSWHMPCIVVMDLIQDGNAKWHGPGLFCQTHEKLFMEFDQQF